MTKKGKLTLLFITIVVATAIVVAIIISKIAGGKYDAFAECLTDKGTIIYGTEWCSHCKAQKELFGRSFKKVNYVDCDTEKETCLKADIAGYPTWKMGDGEALVGTQQLTVLAEKTGCELTTEAK